MVQLHEDFAIMRSNRGIVAKGQAVLLRNNAKVIEDELDLIGRYGAANLVLHGAEDLFSAFNARPRSGTHVQAELSGIHIWKEITPDPGQRQQRTADHQPKYQKHRGPIHQTPT